MTTVQMLLTIGAVVLGTMTTRFLPFLIFPGSKPTPKYVQYLGKVLPYAVIGLLVSLMTGSHGIPELLGTLSVAGLHLWKKNMLLSIGVGTIVYMLLVQLVF